MMPMTYTTALESMRCWCDHCNAGVDHVEVIPCQTLDAVTVYANCHGERMMMVVTRQLIRSHRIPMLHFKSERTPQETLQRQRSQQEILNSTQKSETMQRLYRESMTVSGSTQTISAPVNNSTSLVMSSTASYMIDSRARMMEDSSPGVYPIRYGASPVSEIDYLSKRLRESETRAVQLERAIGLRRYGAGFPMEKPKEDKTIEIGNLPPRRMKLDD